MFKLPAEFEELKKQYMRGFKPVGIYSLLTHTDMETGYALSIGLRESANGHYLRASLPGRREVGAETVLPEAFAPDGSYTSVKIEFEGVRFRVESCVTPGCPLLLLITPLSRSILPPVLVLESGFLWNRSGVTGRDGNHLIAVGGDRRFIVHSTAPHIRYDLNLPTQTPYLAAVFDGEIAFSVNRQITPEEARRIMAGARENYMEALNAFSPCESEFKVLACALGWDATYDASNDRMLIPLSRLSAVNCGGSLLSCSDSYFSGFMAVLLNPYLSYSNLIWMTLSATRMGFIPDFIHGTGLRSEDRSQPPVGSAMVLEVFRRTHSKWLAELLYPYLLRWNIWFSAFRMEDDGALCWGSNPITPEYGSSLETDGVNQSDGAAAESGMADSPLYKDVPFDKEKHRLCLKDVGLTGLYILDTRSLIQLAQLLGKEEDLPLLRARLSKAENGLEMLWDDSIGFYCNRRTDTGEFSHRLSPTGFYALFSDHISSEHKARIAAHYFDSQEFFGDWMLPSIARNDSAFEDQAGHRGRIWPEMNFLVYLALCRHSDLRTMRRDLASKSEALLQKDIVENPCVSHSFHALSGQGTQDGLSTHSGALLSIISMAEKGLIPGLGADLRL